MKIKTNSGKITATFVFKENEKKEVVKDGKETKSNKTD
jgi:hypothetical protein